METQPVFVQFSDLVRHFGLDSWKTSETSTLGTALVWGHAETRHSSKVDSSVVVNITEIAAFVNCDGEVISYMMYADCDVE